MYTISKILVNISIQIGSRMYNTYYSLFIVFVNDIMSIIEKSMYTLLFILFYVIHLDVDFLLFLIALGKVPLDKSVYMYGLLTLS